MRKVLALLRSAVGVDEVILVAALLMITAALWPSLGWLALLPAGLVLLWISIPQRARFVARPSERKEK